jgi:predicted PurR-regulated permease PerM
MEQLQEEARLIMSEYAVQNQPAAADEGPVEGPPAELQASSRRGKMAWNQLWLHVTSITPAQVGRLLLAAAMVSLIVWLIGRAGASMLPFWFGLVLAYATLPIVNWLDRVMPRLLAVVLLLSLETAILVLAVVALAPILANEIVGAVQSLPSVVEIRSWRGEVLAWLQTLPVPVQEFVSSWLQTAYTRVNQNFGAFLLRFLSAGAATAFDALRWLTFLFSFLILPSWLIYVLRDLRAARTTADRALPPVWRADFWALMGIIHRTASAFLRGRLAIAVLGGLLLGIGLQLLQLLGFPPMPFPVLVPLIVAIFALVPILGPIVGLIPVVLVALSVSTELAVAAALVYVGVGALAKALIVPRTENWAVDIHPALLAPIVVLGSTFGFWGAVLAGPMAVVVRDIYRYLDGRLADPPRPAGLLPGAEPEPTPLPAQQVPLRRPRPLAGDRT